MEKIGKILESLNLDETFFYQMGIFIALFFVLKTIFFEKLQEVIRLREEKTVRRKKANDKKFAEAEELAANYREKIREANAKGREIYGRHKREIVEKEKVRLKEVEEKLNVEFEKEIDAFREEAEHGKKELLKNSDVLCEKLVEKLTA